MKNKLYFQLLIFAILFYVVHFVVSKYFLPKYFLEEIYQMHLFLGLITFLLIFLIQRITKVDKTNFGKGYLVSVVLKMLIAIGFLWSVIFTPSLTQKLYVVHFFIVFFVYLIIEVNLLISSIK